MKHFKIILSIAVLLSFPAFSQAPPVQEPVRAKVLGIDDANTILVERLNEPDTKIKIQLRGFELAHHNGACDFERDLAQETTAAIIALVDGQNVTILNASPSSNKRVAEADILNYESINIGEYLFLEKGLAHPTNTGASIDWCGKEN